MISVPLGFFGGIGAASKQGVLVKGSNYLEALSEMKTIVFDKTGTLTKGEFVVSEVIPNGWEKEGLLEVAALAEGYSDHPISAALKKAYEEAELGELSWTGWNRLKKSPDTESRQRSTEELSMPEMQS